MTALLSRVRKAVASSGPVAPVLGTGGNGSSSTAIGPFTSDQVVVVNTMGASGSTPTFTGSGTWLQIVNRTAQSRSGTMFVGYGFTGSGTTTVAGCTFMTWQAVDCGRTISSAPTFTNSAWKDLGGSTTISLNPVTPAVGDIVVAHISNPASPSGVGARTDNGNSPFTERRSVGTGNMVVSAAIVATNAVPTWVAWVISGATSKQAVMVKITLP